MYDTRPCGIGKRSSTASTLLTKQKTVRKQKTHTQHTLEDSSIDACILYVIAIQSINQ
jgi:hypothetical protein